MRKITITLMAILMMAVTSTPALASIDECETEDCVPAMSDTALEFLASDGTLKGSVTYGSGAGTVSSKDGYSVIARTSNTDVAVVNVAGNGTYCTLNVGSPKYSTVLNGHVYVVNSGGDEVIEADMNCNNRITIAVGNSPLGITTDGVYLYVVNQLDGNLTRIDPVTHAATPLDIGVTQPFVDQLAAVCYNPVVDALYVSTAWGFKEILLPGLSTNDWVQGTSMTDIKCNDTHVLIGTSMAGNAYLVPVANFSNAAPLGTLGPRSVALGPNDAFVSRGTVDGIEKFNMSGTSQGMIASTLYWSISYLAPTASPPVCPNGTMEGTEECDGSDFGIETCLTQNFDGGSLSCTGTCTIDTSGCTYTCGNNVAAPTEECDGTDHKGQDCTTLGLGFTGGTLACSGCSFDTSGCTVAPTCNDGNVDAGEDCDGANLDGATCQSEGYFGGTLACTGACAFDFSGCTNCGNGTADASEDCDGADLNNNECTDLGFDSGTLACNVSCTFDTGSCVLNSCGNSLIDNGETCDDGNNMSSDGCSNVCQTEPGYECSGTPSVCTLICGNNTVDTGEECDGDNLNGATCADFGGEGNLTCKSDCTLDTSSCLACNDPQIVYDITINDIDQEQLNGHNATLFANNLGDLTEADGDRITCGDFEVAGETVPSVVVSLNPGEYKLVRISGNGSTANCMVFTKASDAKLYVNISDPKKTRLEGSDDGYGLICVHAGEDMQFEIDGLLLGTLGTALSYQYLTYNPEAKVNGNWAEIYVSTDGVKLIELEDPTNRSGDLFVASFTNGPKYVNLDAKGDLSEIGRLPVDPPEGCCSTGKTGATPPYIPLGLVFLFLLYGLWRSRRRSLQMQRIKKRDR
ncbi:DUF4215 domain-containing protein [Patescibacteria group bacterium]